MKILVKAEIKWRLEEAGGRKPPPLGTRYAPIIRFVELKEERNEAWSVELICTEICNQMMQVEISFLSSEGPYYCLKKGNKFLLLEGERIVAEGMVLE